MKNRIVHISLILFSFTQITLSVPTELLSNNKKRIAICFDFDNVITKRGKPRITDLPLLGSILMAHPIGTLYALWDFEKIKKQGKEFAQEEPTPNIIIGKMIGYLKEQGYGDFSDSEASLLKFAVQTDPIDPIVALIRKLKDQGYILIGGTNQNYEQNIIYRRELAKKGISLDELFDAIPTTHTAHATQTSDIQSSVATPANSTQVEKIVFMACKNIMKPDSDYYEIMKQIAAQFNADTENILFIDDLQQNITGANNRGIKGIHFDVKVDHANQKQLLDAVKKVENTINEYTAQSNSQKQRAVENTLTNNIIENQSKSSYLSYSNIFLSGCAVVGSYLLYKCYSSL